jgi:hypothetical protein
VGFAPAHKTNLQQISGEPMPAIILTKHFDGQKTALDEAFDIPPNANLLVTLDLEQLF